MLLVLDYKVATNTSSARAQPAAIAGPIPQEAGACPAQPQSFSHSASVANFPSGSTAHWRLSRLHLYFDDGEGPGAGPGGAGPEAATQR